VTIVLRPVTDGDVEYLYDWCLDPSVARTWRYRGMTPPPEVFRNQLWQGVLANFIGVRRGSDIPASFVTLYDVNLAAGHGKLSCLVAPELRMGTTAVDTVLQMLEFAFGQWPLRKVYFETNSIAIQQYSSAVARGLLVEEARLLNYELFGDGSWADLIFLAVDRECWDDVRTGHLAARITGSRVRRL
jgi:hypothetical protein